MHLQLEPDVEIVLQQPLDDLARINSAKDWRKQHGPAAIGEIKFGDFLLWTKDNPRANR